MNCFSFDLKLLLFHFCSYQDIFPGFGIPLGNMFYFLQGWHCSFFSNFILNKLLFIDETVFFLFFLNNINFSLFLFFPTEDILHLPVWIYFYFYFLVFTVISMIWNNNFKKYGNASSRTLSNIWYRHVMSIFKTEIICDIVYMFMCIWFLILKFQIFLYLIFSS